MGIRVSWYEHISNVIYYEFVAPWTWQEYEQAFQQELALAATLSGQRYDVIANLTQGIPVPHTIDFTIFFRTIHQSPPSFATAILVGQSALLNIFVITINQLYSGVRGKLLLVSSLGLAQQHIIATREHDAAIPQKDNGND